MHLSKPCQTRRLRLLTAVLVAIALAACSSSKVEPSSDPSVSLGGQAKPSFDRFPDMPMPNGFDLDMGRTLVFGGGDSWFGRLAVTSRYGANEMFDFYKQELARFGWDEVTSIRAPVSVLTYTRQDRVATLQIQGRTIYGSEVLITVSPRGVPVQGGGFQGSSAPGSLMPPPVQTIR